MTTFRARADQLIGKAVAADVVEEVAVALQAAYVEGLMAFSWTHRGVDYLGLGVGGARVLEDALTEIRQRGAPLES